MDSVSRREWLTRTLGAGAAVVAAAVAGETVAEAGGKSYNHWKYKYVAHVCQILRKKGWKPRKIKYHGKKQSCDIYIQGKQGKRRCCVRGWKCTIKDDNGQTPS